jgi:hypothetical protein
MKIATLLLSISLLSCFGRTSNDSKDSKLFSINNQFQKALKVISPGENASQYKAYVVIPNSGCSGCITSAEEMLKQSVKTSTQIKFILTNIESLKMLSYKMGFDVTKNKMILIDKGNLFNSGSLMSIYPQILLIDAKDGNVYKKMDVSPEEDGIRLLKEQYLIK